jgi:hypothetical protein
VRKGKTKSRTPRLPKLSTPANVRRLFALVNDKTQTENGLHVLAETLDEVAPHPDPLRDFQLFRRFFTPAAEEVERTRGQLYTRRFYRKAQEMLVRAAQGETLDEIAAEWERAANARMAERKQAALQAPEPKDKRSAEWRYWKLRQVERAFAERDQTEGYDAAWRFVRELFDGLYHEPNFWHVDLVLPLLPHLIIARQKIDEIFRYEHRSQAGMKGARTRKQRLAQKGGA